MASASLHTTLAQAEEVHTTENTTQIAVIASSASHRQLCYLNTQKGKKPHH